MTDLVDVTLPDGTVLKDVPNTDEAKQKIAAKVRQRIADHRFDQENKVDPMTLPPDVRDETMVFPGARTKAEKVAGDFGRGFIARWNNRDPGIDYHTGLNNFGFRKDFSMMDTDAEKQKFLNERVGEGKWAQDSHGAYVLSQEGVEALGGEYNGYPVAIDEHRLSMGDVADLRGDVPAMIGGMIGGQGRVKAGLAVIKSALYTMVGKGAQETYEAVIGQNLQSPWEVGLDTLEEGAWAAGGEAATRFVSVAGRKLFAPNEELMDPTRRAAMSDAQKMGLQLRSSQITDAKLTGYAEGVWARIFGDKKAAENSLVLHREISRLKNEAGRGGSLAETGAQMQGRVRRRIAAFQELHQRYLGDARRLVYRNSRDFAERLGKQDGDIGTAVVTDIKSSLTGFYNQMRDAYRIIDETAGKTLYPTAKLKQEAADQLARIQRTEVVQTPATPDQVRFSRSGGKEVIPGTPATTSGGQAVVASPGYVAELQRILDLPDNIDLAGAQEIRSALREASYTFDVFGKPAKHNSKRLVKALDEGFDDVENGAIPEISAMMKSARQAYAEGLSVYDDAFIRAITRDKGAAGALDPSMIVDSIARDPGKASALKQLMAKTKNGATVWANVRRSHFESAVDAATDLEGNINPVKFAAQFSGTEGRKNAAKEIYGVEMREVQQLIRDLGALEGKIPVKDLQAGSVKDAIKKVHATKAQWDQFTDQDWVKQLGKTGAEQVTAVSHVFKPKSPALVKAAREFYGENSETWSRVKRVAMKDILSTIVDESKDNPFQSVFNGHKLTKALDKYGRETINEMFGKDMADQLYKFARVTKVVTRDPSKGAGSIAVAAIMMRPFSNISRLGKLWVISSVFSSPRGIRYLTDGAFSLQTSGGRMTREAAQNLTRLSALMYAIPEDDNGDLLQYFGFSSSPEDPSKQASISE